MTGVRERTRTLIEKLRFDLHGEAHWVEPGNWITKAILSGDLEPRRAELAPDNVILTAPAAQTLGSEPAIARAG
jgi:hypothetical protein